MTTSTVNAFWREELERTGFGKVMSEIAIVDTT